MKYFPLFALLVFALTGCGLFGGGLKSRAADYYGFMLGHGKDVKYSSFLSPEYRKTFSADALANLDNAMRMGNVKGGRIPKVEPGHINVFNEANFYVTTISPEAGEGYQGISLTKWVKVGSGWYIYGGSEAEAGKYGLFPDSLLAKAQAAATSDEPKEDFSAPPPVQQPVEDAAQEPEPEAEAPAEDSTESTDEQTDE